MTAQTKWRPGRRCHTKRPCARSGLCALKCRKEKRFLSPVEPSRQLTPKGKLVSCHILNVVKSACSDFDCAAPSYQNGSMGKNRTSMSHQLVVKEMKSVSSESTCPSSMGSGPSLTDKMPVSLELWKLPLLREYPCWARALLTISRRPRV